MNGHERLTAVVTRDYPKMKIDRSLLRQAIATAADLVRDDEVVRTFYARTSPARIRGSGLVVVTDTALVAVDLHPSDETRSTRVEWHDVRSVSSAPAAAQGGAVIVMTDSETLQLISGNPRSVSDMLESLRSRLDSSSRSTTPADLVTNWWDDPTITWPHTFNATGKWDYLGGLPGYDRPRSGLVLDLSRLGVRATKPGALGTSVLEFNWQEVRGVEVEGAQQVQRRITATRLLAVGVFALAWKKREKSTFLVMELSNGSEVIFSTGRFSQPELRSRLATVLSRANRSAAAVAEAGADSPAVRPRTADRLREIAALRDDGLITDTEYDTKRADILKDV